MTSKVVGELFFPVDEDESDEDAVSDESVERRLSPLLEGADPQVVHRNLYRVHQRVAKSWREGRVFLAGDSAHLNNPIGGLGLNCGIHDATELIETLLEFDGGNNSQNLLDRYERRRKTLNIESVQQQTIDNKRRLEETEEDKRQARLNELSRIAADPALMKKFLRRTFPDRQCSAGQKKSHSGNFSQQRATRYSLPRLSCARVEELLVRSDDSEVI